MVHPDPEVLAGLALDEGDAGDERGPLDAVDPVDVEARRHVSACARCAADVADLRRVAHLAREGELDPGPDGWQHPPADLWSRIDAQLDAEPAAGRGDGPPALDEPAGPGEPGVLRLAGTTAAGARRAGPPSRTTQRRADGRARRTTLAWLAAACAAGVLAGVGGAWSFWREPTPAARTTTLATVPLASLDTRQQQGRAVLEDVAGRLDLRVDSTALDARSGFLEVWLLNADGKRMVSLGMLQQPDSTFPVSQEMLDKGYVIVDVSREAFDDRPQHSGDSLLRGRLSV